MKFLLDPLSLIYDFYDEFQDLLREIIYRYSLST